MDGLLSWVLGYSLDIHDLMGTRWGLDWILTNFQPDRHYVIKLLLCQVGRYSNKEAEVNCTKEMILIEFI
jgi:hypothetical protein